MDEFEYVIDDNRHIRAQKSITIWVVSHIYICRNFIYTCDDVFCFLDNFDEVCYGDFETCGTNFEYGPFKLNEEANTIYKIIDDYAASLIADKNVSHIYICRNFIYTCDDVFCFFIFYFFYFFIGDFLKNFSINMSKIKPLYYYVNTKIMKTMFKIVRSLCRSFLLSSGIDRRIRRLPYIRECANAQSEY